MRIMGPIISSKTASNRFTEITPLPPIENLVFKGGGAKGIAYSGAIKALGELGIFPQVKRVAGSSAGAITALLIAVCGSPQQVAKEMASFDLSTAKDPEKDSTPVFPLLKAIADIFHAKKPIQQLEKKISACFSLLFSKKHALYQGEILKRKISEIVEKYLGDKNATFADLKRRIHQNPERFKAFTVTANSLNGLQNKPHLYFFGTEENASVKIADAVCASASFPGAFPPVEIEVQGKKQLFIDGGASDNFPIEIFERPPYAMGNLSPEGRNTKTLGFRTDNASQMAATFNQHLTESHAALRQGSLVDLFKALLGVVTDANDLQKITAYGMQLVQIDPQGVDTLDFDMPKEKRDALIKAGFDATYQYYRNYRQDAFLAILPQRKAAIKAKKASECCSPNLANLGSSASSGNQERLSEAVLDLEKKYDSLVELSKKALAEMEVRNLRRVHAQLSSLFEECKNFIKENFSQISQIPNRKGNASTPLFLRRQDDKNLNSKVQKKKFGNMVTLLSRKMNSTHESIALLERERRRFEEKVAQLAKNQEARQLVLRDLKSYIEHKNGVLNRILTAFVRLGDLLTWATTFGQKAKFPDVLVPTPTLQLQKLKQLRHELKRLSLERSSPAELDRLFERTLEPHQENALFLFKNEVSSPNAHKTKAEVEPLPPGR